MAVINELIRAEENGTLSFGNFTLAEKAKNDGFLHDGGSYKVKTYKDITKLERDGIFVYESVPGTAVNSFAKQDAQVSFTVEGVEDAQITLELEAESDYEINIDGESAGIMKTNLGGKLSFSVELEENKSVSITIEKR